MMTAIGLLRHQVGFDLTTFRRNPAATFFTVVLPLIFLLIFTAIFGNEDLPSGAKVATLYVPGILSMAIFGATCVNLAITMTTRRERGMLKRLRGTPIDPQMFVISQSVAAVVVASLTTVLLIVVGRILFGVELNWSTAPALIVTLIVGAGGMGALGLALTAVIPSEEAAPAVTNVIALPLYFISGVFIPDSELPGWVLIVARVFPIYHLNKALQGSFDPFLEGSWWPVGHWVVLAAWGLVGAVAAHFFFRWVPRR